MGERWWRQAVGRLFRALWRGALRPVRLVSCATLAGLALAAGFAPAALAAGGHIVFAGGTPGEREQVQGALDASSFDWSLLPQITVHIGSVGASYATPRNVYLDASLLDAGEFSWGVVLHEFGHQVDFLLLTDAERVGLTARLGAEDWCYGVPGLPHAAYGCERFASELAWAYWPSPQNCMRPASPGDEAAGMPADQFRALLAQFLGAPTATLAALTYQTR